MRGRGFAPASWSNNQNYSQNKSGIQWNNSPNTNWKGSNREGNFRESSGRIPCQICGRTNHTAIKCNYRYDYAYQEEDTPEALAVLAIQDGNDTNFYVDSGAMTHMTNDLGKLESAHSYNGQYAIYVGNGNKLPIPHTGDALLKTSHGHLKLKDALVAPKLKKNLLSVSQLTLDNSCIFEFDANGFVIKDRNQQILAKGHRRGQLYALEEAQSVALAAIRSQKSDLCHQRLGHAHSNFFENS